MTCELYCCLLPQYEALHICHSGFSDRNTVAPLFMSTTVILPNYTSGNIKTNSIQPVSTCLAVFYSSVSGLAFFVHLDWQPW